MQRYFHLASRTLKGLAGFILVMFAGSILVSAQTGSISGTVTDTAGAVVPGAEITVRNAASGAIRVVNTGDTGNYSITSLAPGAYEVVAKKASFKAFRVPSINLTVDQVLTVNASLEPGAVTEEVQVQADQLPAVDLETSQVSNLVSQSQMQNLPLITRDPYSLILLSAGTMQSNTYLGGFSVNGERERNNSFLLDGADNNDTSVPGGSGGLTSLNPDATEEFRVITNNFMPEFGDHTGAIVDVVTKSGTNDFHGSAYWFGRYNGFGGARDYFNPAIDGSGNPSPMNPYVRNQFGFSVGGPIIKNKTFFFINNEFQRFRTTLTATSTVPTPAFKSGVFNYTDPNGTVWPVDLSDPASPNNAQGVPIDPFITGSVLSLYPDPNGPLVDETRGLYFFPSKSSPDVWNSTNKIDQRFSDRESLSLRYAYNQFNDPNACATCDFLPGLGGYSEPAKAHNAAATLTSTLSSTLINVAKFGFNRVDAGFFCNNLSELNAIGPTDQYGRSRDYTMPGISGFGCSALSDSDGQFRRTGTWSWGDSISWVKGAHTMKFGGDFRRIYENGYDSFGARDTATFAGFSNFSVPWVNLDPSNPCDPSNGDFSTNGCGSPDLQNMGDMLFGYMDTESQNQFFDHSGNQTSTDNRDFRYHEYDFYGQDSWKVRSNLTLNFGLRYQFNGVPYEVHNNFSSLFQDPQGSAPFTFEVVGPGTGRQIYNNDWHDFEPRLGFAWDPFNTTKTSIRGGFGIFHDRIFGNLLGNTRSNPPFQESYFNEPFTLPDGTDLPPTVPPSPEIDQDAFFTPTLIDPNLKMPYSANWNFGIQRELTSSLTLEANYVGSSGVRLYREFNGNSPQPSRVQTLLQSGECFGGPCTQADVSGSGLLYEGGYFGIYTLNGERYDAVNNTAFFEAIVNQAHGHSTYHAAQLTLTKRMSRGLQIQGAYTWAHAIDDSADPIAVGEGAFAHGLPRNSFALGNERGNSDFDVRQRLVINYVWELPFGKGQAFVNHGFLGRVLEGWQLSGVTTFQTGLHYSVFGFRDSQHTGLSDRADFLGPVALPAGHDKTETGLPLSAFALPDYGTAGNSGRNRFSGPGTNNWDMVMAKDTSITERIKLELRVEAYNVFNRTAFDLPDGLMADTGTFGFSTNTLTQPDGTTSARQLQFGAKLKF